jgi:hypothetical protein
VPRGYGNWGDPPPKERDTSEDQPHPARSLAQKISSTIPSIRRDTMFNRRLAQQRGWTEEQFQDWVNGILDGHDHENLRDG